jgi:Cu/Ag efflux protein CusF
MKIIGTCLVVSMALAPAAMAAVASPESGRMTTASGQVASIDSAAKSLVVKVAEPSGKPQALTVVVADDSKIIKNGAAISLKELKQGDKVTVTYKAQNGKNMVVNIGVDSNS